MAACAVTLCSADARPDAETCTVHRYAVQAKDIPLATTRRCAGRCRRPIQANDWLLKVGQHGEGLYDATALMHVACAETPAPRGGASAGPGRSLCF